MESATGFEWLTMEDDEGALSTTGEPPAAEENDERALALAKIHDRKVSWKATFIDVADSDSDGQGSLSPRPSSEPSSETSSSFDVFFGADRHRVGRLSAYMKELWNAPVGSAQVREMLAMNAMGTADVTLSAVEPLVGGPSPAQGLQLPVLPQVDLGATAAHHSMASAGLPPCTSVPQTRMEAVVEAISVIPDNLGQILQHKAQTLADEVHSEVDEVRDVVRQVKERSSGSASDTSSASSCEVDNIPNRILIVFEASIASATDNVRERVQALMHTLTLGNLTKAEAVSQLRRIPMELQQIAGDAIESAVAESQSEVAKICDSLDTSLPLSWKLSSQKVANMKSRICQHVPKAVHHTLEDAISAATSTVEHAVAAYCFAKVPLPVPNLAVADALLRAKSKGNSLLDTLERKDGSEDELDASANSIERSDDTSDDYCDRVKGTSDCPLQYDMRPLTGIDGDSNGDQNWLRRPIHDVMSEPCPARGRETRKSQSAQRKGRPLQSSGASSHGVASTPSQAHVRWVIATKAERMNYKQRLSAAAAAIDTIPEQLDGVMQNKANNLAHSVEADLALMRNTIRRSGEDEEGFVEGAVEQLAAIPDIIRTAFETQITAAKDAVQKRLTSMIRELKNNGLEHTELVSQLWTIPEELEQITGGAVDQAVQESKDQAVLHLDHVLQCLPEDAGISRRMLKNVRMQMMEAVPGVYSETMRALRVTTAVNVEHAVAAVDNRDETMVPNRLVADVLLRAKVGDLAKGSAQSASQSSQSQWSKNAQANKGGDLQQSAPMRGACAVSDGAAVSATGDAGDGGEMGDAGDTGVTDDADDADNMAEQRDTPKVLQPGAAIFATPRAGPRAGPSNPGSVGHPEMCSRPCLYYTQGQCANGTRCRFCHHPHPGRPVHLGRQHRRILETGTLSECLSIAFPVLAGKFVALGLARDAFDAYTSQPQLRGDAEVRRIKPRDARTLEKAFAALSLRSLLMALQKKTAGTPSPEQAALDTALQQLRDAGYLIDVGDVGDEVQSPREV